MSGATGDAALIYRDHAMQVTMAVGAHLLAGTCPPPHLDAATRFPPQGGPDERIWGGAPFLLLDFRAPGDGSYVHKSGWAVGFGGLGVLLAAASTAAQAVGNHRRRAAAQRDALPRWVPIDQGVLFVSTAGLYFDTPRGLHPWGWRSISRVELAAPGVLDFAGQSVHGPVSWRMCSEFAELALLCWALACHPRHHQLVTGTWVRPGWSPPAGTAAPTPGVT